MNPDITAQLKALKRITPHASFAARSRAELMALTTPPHNPWRVLEWAGAFAVALVLLFAATFSLPPESTLSASLNEGALVGELNNLPINIELSELTYRAATEATISSAMSEIETTEAQHLNTDILSSELSAFEPEASSSEVEALLHAVLE
jgi:hypothetical protein